MKLQFKRGPQANLPVLDVGEPGLTTDQNRVYVGGTSGNIELAKKGDPVPEVEVARYDSVGEVAYATLGARLDAGAAQLADIAINVKLFGAKGDGVTDDTAAIQAAINAVCTNPGGLLFIPGGTYKLTNEISIPFSTGWKIVGVSRGKTILKQFTNNKPIFRFTTALTHSWKIEELSFDYASQQPSSNTLAIPVYFPLDSGSGGAGYFNFQIVRCSFSNCFRAIASRDGSGGIALWGVTIRDCAFNGSMTGAGFFAIPTPSVGQPNINLENCYFDCDSTSEASIKMASGDIVTLKNVELNKGIYAGSKSQLDISTVNQLTIIASKSEDADFSSGGALWSFPNARVNIIGCAANLTDVAASAIVKIVQTSANGKLIVHGFSAGVINPGAGSAIGMFSATDFVFSSNIDTQSPITKILAGESSPRIDADMQQRNTTTVRGDAAVVLVSTDGRVQYFNTTLTANRNVTLPGTGLYDGLEFEIIRQATGAFTLTIIDPVSGKNTVIAASAKGFVRYRARSTGEWMIMATGVIP